MEDEDASAVKKPVYGAEELGSEGLALEVEEVVGGARDATGRKNDDPDPGAVNARRLLEGGGASTRSAARAALIEVSRMSGTVTAV